MNDVSLREQSGFLDARPIVSLSSPISVLMPVRNGGAFLQAAVKSILAQQNVTLELIIIDDGSTDDAINQLDFDDRLFVTQNPEAGIVSALNHGLYLAKYPLLARMDADDIAHPLRLHQQLEFYCSHPEIDIVGSKVEIFSTDRGLGGGFKYYQEWINAKQTNQQIRDHIFVECPIPHPTFFLSTALARSLNGYRDNGWPEDYDLILRAFLNGANFGKPSAQTLLRWRDHDNRLSRNGADYHQRAFLRCKAFYLAQHLKRLKIDETVIWGAGPTGLKLHDYLEEYGITVAAFYDINPKLQGRTKRFKPVHVLALPLRSTALKSIGSFVIISINQRGAAHEMEMLFEQAGAIAHQDFIRAS